MHEALEGVGGAEGHGRVPSSSICAKHGLTPCKTVQPIYF